MNNRTRTRLAASLVAASLAATGCGSGESADTAGDAATTVATSPVATSPVVSTETTVPPDCPVVPPPPIDEVAVAPLPPVDPDAQPYEAREEQMAGRYGFESLGVAIAFDATAAMFSTESPSDQALYFSALGVHPSFLRPVGLLEDAFDRLDTDAPKISFDEWLALWSDQMGIIDDRETTVGGRNARAITFLPPDGNVLDEAGFGLYEPRLLLNDRWPTRIIRVDIDDPNPLYIVIGRNDRSDAPEVADWIEITDEWVATIEIGDINPSPARPWSGAPWDTGGLLRTSEVEGPCQVSSIAIGGVEFEVAERTWLSVAGNEIWLRDPEQRHVGVEEPIIRVIAPSFVWNQESFEADRTEGETVSTVDDAVAQFGQQGWQLTEVEAATTLLGAPARAFEIAGPDQPSYLFAVGSHAGSARDELGLPPHRVGRALLAETERGVVIAMLDAEIDTDDGMILSDRFDRLIATLAFIM